MLDANVEFKQHLKEAGVPIWKLADKMGCHESTLLRKLRHELSDEEKQKMLHLVEDIKAGK